MDLTDVLYEDNHVIGVFKPAGRITQGDRSGKLSLLDDVKAFLKERESKSGNVFLGLVHRLDRMVCGVVVFGKTSKGASRLSEAIREHNVEKIYLARVEGVVPWDQKELDQWWEWNDEKARAMISESPSQKKAQLIVKRLSVRGKTSFVEVKLLTGRKHQIRAQLSFCGYPILGDVRYGAVTKRPEGITLCCIKMAFPHTTQRKEIIDVSLSETELRRRIDWLD